MKKIFQSISYFYYLSLVFVIILYIYNTNTIFNLLIYLPSISFFLMLGLFHKEHFKDRNKLIAIFSTILKITSFIISLLFFQQKNNLIIILTIILAIIILIDSILLSKWVDSTNIFDKARNDKEWLENNVSKAKLRLKIVLYKVIPCLLVYESNTICDTFSINIYLFILIIIYFYIIFQFMLCRIMLFHSISYPKIFISALLDLLMIVLFSVHAYFGNYIGYYCVFIFTLVQIPWCSINRTYLDT